MNFGWETPRDGPPADALREENEGRSVSRQESSMQGRKTNEEEHEDHQHGNSNTSLRRVSWPVIRVDSNHGSADGVAGGHAEGSDEQRRLAADLVERPEGRADSDELPEVMWMRRKEVSAS